MVEEQALPALVEGLRVYEVAGVDYLELNESCPNVPGHTGGHGSQAAVLDAGLRRRLHYVAEHFLQHRTRPLPVVVKFSTDTQVDQVDTLVRTLIDLGFDGVILGNTSIQYDTVRKQIVSAERSTYDLFTSRFGGGLSGSPLRSASLALCAQARRVADACAPHHEFHVIRCGGIASAADIAASANVGIKLNQWYVGYFEAFAAHGHALYQRLAAEIDA
jgi:dihydroorotate dehydrogenase